MDAYKYLSATITVLAALTSAAIRSNPDSSRVVSAFEAIVGIWMLEEKEVQKMVGP